MFIGLLFESLTFTMVGYTGDIHGSHENGLICHKLRIWIVFYFSVGKISACHIFILSTFFIKLFFNVFIKMSLSWCTIFHLVCVIPDKIIFYFFSKRSIMSFRTALVYSKVKVGLFLISHCFSALFWSVWLTTPLCTTTSTASHTSASCLKPRAIMMRVLATDPTKSFGSCEEKELKSKWSCHLKKTHPAQH